MRMAFGIVGILGALVAIVWIMSYTLGGTETTLKVGKQKKQEVRQIAGYDESGVRATDTVKLAAETSSGKLTGVLVTNVTPGGAMEKHYGLKRNDSIVEIAMGGGALTPVKEMGSADEAKDALLTAYQNSQPIVIVRDEKRITLPLESALSATRPAKAAPTAGATPAGKTKDSVQQQLESIPGIR